MRILLYFLILLIFISSAYALFDNPFSILDVSNLENVNIKINLTNKEDVFCLQNGICFLKSLSVQNLSVNNSVNFTTTNYNVTGTIDADEIMANIIYAQYYYTNPDLPSIIGAGDEPFKIAYINAIYTDDFYMPSGSSYLRFRSPSLFYENAIFQGNATATYFKGNGSLLTDIDTISNVNDTDIRIRFLDVTENTTTKNLYVGNGSGITDFVFSEMGYRFYPIPLFSTTVNGELLTYINTADDVIPSIIAQDSWVYPYRYYIEFDDGSAKGTSWDITQAWSNPPWPPNTDAFNLNGYDHEAAIGDNFTVWMKPLLRDNVTLYDNLKAKKIEVQSLLGVECETDDYSLSFGYQTTASSQKSVALNAGTIADGSTSIAVGQNTETKAGCYTCFAGGFTSIAQGGTAALAFGNNATSNGAATFTLGHNIINNDAYSIAIGWAGNTYFTVDTGRTNIYNWLNVSGDNTYLQNVTALNYLSYTPSVDLTNREATEAIKKISSYEDNGELKVNHSSYPEEVKAMIPTMERVQTGKNCYFVPEGNITVCDPIFENVVIGYIDGLNEGKLWRLKEKSMQDLIGRIEALENELCLHDPKYSWC